jgi:tetratricopeptide (TPR) repeat protein
MRSSRGGIRTAKQIRNGIALFGTFLLACTAGVAGDFPGKGEYADWSAALPYYNQANRYLNQGRYQDAILKYQTAIMQYQYDPDFYINLGVAFRKSDQYEAAEDALKRATELSPKDWIPWSDLANAYLKQNRLKETISAFQRALKCNPPSVEANAMRKDIQDIEKILRMQGKPGAAATATEADQSSAKKKGGMSSNSTTTAKHIKQAGTPAQTKKEQEMLQKSGWDYITK